VSLESFRDDCEKSKFYFFISTKDFDKRIDWEGRSVKNIAFERGLVDEGENNCPTRWSAYGTKHKPEVDRCLPLDNKQEGKEVFEYSVFGSPQQKIGDFVQSKLSGWSS